MSLQEADESEERARAENDAGTSDAAKSGQAIPEAWRNKRFRLSVIAAAFLLAAGFAFGVGRVIGLGDTVILTSIPRPSTAKNVFIEDDNGIGADNQANILQSTAVGMVHVLSGGTSVGIGLVLTESGKVLTTYRPSAGATNLAALDTVLARGYDGGTDLSGGQWQRIALARALAAVKLGAGVVLLDEPTAQLDVRGEAEIFDHLLAATRHCTTILISHRFSTVRHADRICVLEHGKVVELGTHDELMALGGRYHTMFDLQAQRFTATEDEEGKTYDLLA